MSHGYLEISQNQHKKTESPRQKKGKKVKKVKQNPTQKHHVNHLEISRN
jgi:hypothetical protein